MKEYDKRKSQWWEFYVLSSPVEVVIVVVLFQIQFIQLMGSFCRWAPFMVYIVPLFF